MRYFRFWLKSKIKRYVIFVFGLKSKIRSVLFTLKNNPILIVNC